MSKKEKNTEDINEEKKNEHLLRRGLRRKTGINTHLLSMRLIQATYTTDIKSIIVNTCMASSMIEGGYPDKLDGFDFEKFRIIKKIFDNIKQNTKYYLKLPKQDYSYRTDYAEVYAIPWSININEEFYRKHILPWAIPLDYNSHGIKKHRKWHVAIIHKGYYGGCEKVIAVVESNSENSDEVKAEERKWRNKICPVCEDPIGGNLKTQIVSLVVEEPEWSFFFEMSQCLTDFGLKKLYTSFEEYARDECGKAIMFFGKLVPENVYDDVLKQLRGQPDGVESEEK